MKILKRTPAALVLCAALLLCAASDLRAQAAAAGAAAQRMLRPMLTAQFLNVGIQDGFYGAVSNSGAYLIYPNMTGAGNYGTIRLSQAASTNWEAWTLATRLGHGVWTMTSDQRVIYTGPGIGMQSGNIFPMQYDVSADPDLSKLGTRYFYRRWSTVKLGFGTRSTTGLEETSLGGNWYPSSDLIEVNRKVDQYNRPPVHIMNFNLAAYPTNDTWPEEIIVTKWTTAQGLTFTERAFAWSHPDFDDFILDEYIIENTGDNNGDGKRELPEAALNNLFIGFMDRYRNSAAGEQQYRSYWSADQDWGMDDWYGYDSKLKLIYNWDGDSPNYNAWDDTGDPYYDAYVTGTTANGGKDGQTEGMLMSPTTVGGGVLAYTNDPASSYKFNARDISQGYVAPDGDQPYSVRFWESYNINTQDDPNILRVSEAKMYSDVIGQGRKIDQPPTRVSGQFAMSVFGPYNLPPGGKAKIVLAYVGGHPGQVLGNTDAFTWAKKGNKAELTKGQDALKQNFEAVRFAYANAYDIPDAPPDVNFRTGSNSTANMTVDWPTDVENSSHPDYTGTVAKDIAGYRVYRSTWFDQGPWELVADIPKGTASKTTSTYRVTLNSNVYLFEDLQSAAGYFYHYSVRAYAAGHATWSGGSAISPLDMTKLPTHIAQRVQLGQEGGWSAPTQRIYADESPFAVPSAQTEALEAKVRVVPNPFVIDAEHAYPGSTKMRFVGVPSKCRIQVFSVSGERVSDFILNDATRAEIDYNQVTWVYNGEIATGLYFWVVENKIPGPNLGKLQRGYLMVIR